MRRIPAEKQAAENRALMETYGKQVDFTDFRTLEPIIQEIQDECYGQKWQGIRMQDS